MNKATIGSQELKIILTTKKIILTNVYHIITLINKVLNLLINKN